MTYKLAVGDFIDFPVTLEFNDAGTPRKFTFRLVSKRLPESVLSQHTDQMLSAASTIGGRVDSTNALLQAYVTDWRDQRLVLDDEGQPAPFSADAFAVMLAQNGAAVEISRALTEANRAKGKPGN
jgi:hypothetical protein